MEHGNDRLINGHLPWALAYHQEAGQRIACIVEMRRPHM